MVLLEAGVCDAVQLLCAERREVSNTSPTPLRVDYISVTALSTPQS